MARLSLLAPVAGLAALAGLATPAMAQTIRMFDAPPPLELLRSIMVPESQGGLSRRIVLPHADLPDDARAVQRATVHAAMPVPPPMPSPVAPSPGAPSSVVPAAMPVPAPQPAAVPAPAAAEVEKAAPGIVGFRINFSLDSDAIAPAYRGFIERIGELMRDQPQVKLRIEGHTDALGPDDYNRDLSVRRGVAVAAYLVDRMGIAANRLVVVGKGKSEPLVEDAFDPRNRRVQFVRVD